MTARTFTRIDVLVFAAMICLAGWDTWNTTIAHAQQSTPIPSYACYEDRKPFCPVWGWVRGREPVGFLSGPTVSKGWNFYVLEVAPGFKCEQAEVSDKRDSFTVKCARSAK